MAYKSRKAKGTFRQDGVLDSGCLTLYAISSTEGEAVPGRLNISQIGAFPCQERVVGYAHFYEARRNNATVDKTLRLWWTPEMEAVCNPALCVCAYQERFYRILKLTVITDDDGLAVMDLDLQDDDNNIRRKQGGI